MPPKKQPALRYEPMHRESPLWEHVDDGLKREIGKRRPSKRKIEQANAIADRLEEEFPNAFCALNFEKPFELLVATILSAQCTDVRVNQVTATLFEKYRTPRDYADSPPGELEEDIRSTGFFNSKAKAIRETARQVVEEFGGKVPESMEGLLTLRGAARKTANVVRMHAFHLPGISVDTHFTRITQRLGLTKSTDAKKIEYDIAALLPPEKWTKFADSVILHGRKTCTARKPNCEACCVNDLCPSAFKVKTPAPKKKKAQ